MLYELLAYTRSGVCCMSYLAVWHVGSSWSDPAPHDSLFLRHRTLVFYSSLYLGVIEV